MPDEHDSAIPMFSMRPKLDGPATKTAGHNVFRDVPFVEVVVPGDTKSMVDRPATDADKERWPTQWARFERASADAPQRDGLPIDEWPVVSPAQAMNLKVQNIFMVEDLAAVDDNNIAGIMGGLALREKARAYMERAADGAETNAAIERMKLLTAENAELADKNRMLEAQILLLERQAQAAKALQGAAPQPTASLTGGLGVTQEPADGSDDAAYPPHQEAGP